MRILSRVFRAGIAPAVVSFALLSLAPAGFALAAATIASTTINGGSSVLVTSGASATSTVSTTAGMWHSTAWRIGSGAFACVNTDNHTIATSESFPITAPISAGTYDAEFVIYTNDACTTGASATSTMHDAVVVDTTAPALTSVHVESSNTNSEYAKAFETIILTFTSDEPIRTPSATIAGHAASITNTPLGSSNYEATAMMLSSDAEGTIAYSIGFTDTAGNAGTAVTSSTDDSSVLFDRTKPASVAEIAPAAVSAPSVTVNYHRTDTGGSDIDHVRLWYKKSTSASYSQDGGDFAANGPLSFAFPSGEGIYQFYTREIDLAGNQENAPVSFDDSVVYDRTAPSIGAHADVTKEATGHSGAIVTYASPTVTDNLDGSVSAVCLPASGSTFALGDTTVTCNATDAAGNTATATTFLVHVTDTTAPVIASHADETTEATSAAGAVVTYASPATADLVDGAGTASCAPASGSVFALGDTTVTCTATDAHSNTAIPATFTVTVIDHTAPIMTITPATQTLEATGPSGATVTYSVTATDLVDGDLSSSVSCSVTSGSTFALGDTTVICSVDDAHHNHGSATSHVIVHDTTAPSITAPADQTFEATAPLTAPAGLVSATASDIADPAPIVTHTPTSFSVGTTLVTWTATDASGNHSTATSNVTITDHTAPSISEPDLDGEDESFEATGPVTTPVLTPATATDIADPSVTITYAPHDFHVGVTEVTWTATDASGNHSTATSNVTITDLTAPVITSHADETAEATSAAGAIVTYTAPSATDLVDGVFSAACTPLSGSIFAIGNNTVTCTAHDAALNAAAPITFTVTMRDTTAPIVTITPTTQTLEATGPAGAEASFSTSSEDIVDGSPSVSCDHESGETFAIGDTTVTCTSTDEAENTGSATAHVIVEDTTAPLIAAPADESFEATGPLTTPPLTPATATDIADPSVTITYAPHDFHVGTTEVTWTATDAHGNAATTTSHVIVHDTTAPSITAPADQTFEATAPLTAPAGLVSATASDIADPAPVVSHTPTSFSVGTTLVTWTATDASGNHSTATSNVTITDHTAPSIAPHATATAEATSAAGAIVTYTVPTTADLVDGAGTASCAPASGSTFALGDTTVTCTATDAHGNTATPITFTVTVTDHTAPVITITPAAQTLEASGSTGATATYSVTATDLVDGDLASSVSCSAASGSTFALGDTLVTCSVEDAHHNHGSATAHVIVHDTTAPIIAAHGNESATATASGGATVTYTAPTATDLVDGAFAATCAPASGAFFPIGDTAVTCNATDAHGNHATPITFTVTVVPAAIAKVTVVAAPSSLTTTDTATLTINGRDAFDNITANQSGSVIVVSGDNGGALDGTLATLANGAATAHLTKSAAGAVHVAVSSGSLAPGAATVTFTPADTTGPSVASFSPTQSAADVAISAPVLINFSEPLKSTTVNSSNIQLWKAATSSDPASQMPATVSLHEGDTSAGITPNASLEYGTAYYLVVGTGVTDVAGNALATPLSDANSGFVTTADTADHTAPTIIDHNPADAGTSISVGAHPTVTFSEALQASSVTQTSVTLTKDGAESPLPASVLLENGGTLARITPSSAFEYSTRYHVAISTAVTDEAGNALAAASDTTFTTEAAPADTTAPAISNIQVTAIGTSTAIVTWTTDEASDSQVEYGQTSAYGAATTLDSAMTMSHSATVAGLAGATAYHFRVKSADALANRATSGDNTFATTLDDSTAVLAVSGIDTVRSFATADNTFDHGWKWNYHVTVPTAETQFKMKFSDFVSGANAIPAAANIRFYSAQSSDAASTSTAKTISAANTYSDPITLNADLATSAAGRQIDVIVEMRVPQDTAGGSYSASYGISSII